MLFRLLATRGKIIVRQSYTMAADALAPCITRAGGY